MAFLKFLRDRRGYEHFSLMQPGRGKARPRLLYLFRTPPNVKVGRTPFDPEIQRALEVQNPDVTFDWSAIARTPIPPPDAERWRERRRLERATRAAAEAEDVESVAAAQSAAEEESARLPAMDGTTAIVTEVPVEPLAVQADAPDTTTTSPAASNDSSGDAVLPPGAGRHRRKRRRRNRGWKGPEVQTGQDVQGASGDQRPARPSEPSGKGEQPAEGDADDTKA